MGKQKKVGKATLSCEIEFDRELTSADAIAGALDRVLERALSRDGILDDVGEPVVGSLYISEED